MVCDVLTVLFTTLNRHGQEHLVHAEDARDVAGSRLSTTPLREDSVFEVTWHEHKQQNKPQALCFLSTLLSLQQIPTLLLLTALDIR